MSHFIKSGNTYRVSNEHAVDISKSLPVGTYAMKLNEQHGFFFLEGVEDFSLPVKTYGNNTRYANRILSTYLQREKSTGVLLSGNKGSGKTLLAKTISVNGYSHGIPTIIINSSFYGEEFNTFIQNIDQDCIILFDEFEKIYDEEEQERLLTLLDGTFTTKKLFIFTCNNSYRVDDNMKNRPGRIFYAIEFGGLDREAIVEYCDENLHNKEYKGDIINISQMIDPFNFDMLASIVEESNRYKESPREFMQIINSKPDHYNSTYDVSMVDSKNKVIATTRWNGNIYKHEINISMSRNTNNMFDSSMPDDTIIFRIDSLTKFDHATNEYHFLPKENNPNKYVFIMKKKTYEEFEMSKLLGGYSD